MIGLLVHSPDIGTLLAGILVVFALINGILDAVKEWRRWPR